jgi:hypothetical protein
VISFSPATPSSVREAFDRLKRRNAGKRPVTNYFLNPLEGFSNLRAIETEHSLCFIHDEWDFGRLYFNTYDPADLHRTLSGVTWPPITALDWIAKEAPGQVDSLLTSLGFHVHGVYDRIVCREFRAGQPDSKPEIATMTDRDILHASFFRIFDKYTDHIMPIEDFGKMIADQQVIVTRNQEGAISGFVVFPIANNNCNFNLLYNEGGLPNLTRLLQGFYGTLAERGVKSGFSWVRRTRPLVLQLHQLFGWKTDGLVDHIYLRS